MKTSSEGIALIKRLEGCSLKAYPDATGYSIGYGHYGVSAGLVISQEEADMLLEGDLARFEAAVNRLANITPLSQNQFDALVCLSYNIGTANFQNSTVARLIRERGAAPTAGLRTAWLLWIKSRNPQTGSLEVNQVLVRRRNEEYDHYSGNDNLKKKTADDSSSPVDSIGNGYHCNLK